ncbi:putative tyrosine protein phosphatase OCA1 [Sugiyamaella lignohabitans]|uniref:Putative tyrosine-protein phosphatase OCA1 n=1 Tax=Sugiyamaella lignohabitans TaxID=796027 RepID=A0A167EDE5_9ASCO|nr:putative tyrosine protein phosphatase OCA1 [Sugiyamaella lignohabitans]ANB13932.1 putative tyrosine protein phosphatase OCA1 [Sugiyamaella lignohabitans]
MSIPSQSNGELASGQNNPAISSSIESQQQKSSGVSGAIDRTNGLTNTNALHSGADTTAPTTSTTSTTYSSSTRTNKTNTDSLLNTGTGSTNTLTDSITNTIGSVIAVADTGSSVVPNTSTEHNTTILLDQNTTTTNDSGTGSRNNGSSNNITTSTTSNSTTNDSTISSNTTSSNNTTVDKSSTTLAEIRRPPPVRLVPPLNFALAERQLYRSGQPAPINFPFLRGLNLKTIVWLAVEDPSDAFLGFADNNEIEFHHLGLVTEGGNPWDQLTESSIVSALDIIMNVNNYPLLVCCGMGRHRTGTVIGCLRRVQGWNFASISDEYRRFVGAKGGRVLIELHIEAFDTKSVHINLDYAPDWFKKTLPPPGA